MSVDTSRYDQLADAIGSHPDYLAIPPQDRPACQRLMLLTGATCSDPDDIAAAYAPALEEVRALIARGLLPGLVLPDDPVAASTTGGQIDGLDQSAGDDAPATGVPADPSVDPVAEAQAADAATEIVRLHGEIQTAFQSSLERAIRIGELLLEQKESMEHGEFLPWVAANLPFSERSARNYMRVFSQRAELKSASVADLTAAYRALTPPKPRPRPEQDQPGIPPAASPGVDPGAAEDDPREADPTSDARDRRVEEGHDAAAAEGCGPAGGHDGAAPKFVDQSPSSGSIPRVATVGPTSQTTAAEERPDRRPAPGTTSPGAPIVAEVLTDPPPVSAGAEAGIDKTRAPPPPVAPTAPTPNPGSEVTFKDGFKAVLRGVRAKGPSLARAAIEKMADSGSVESWVGSDDPRDDLIALARLLIDRLQTFAQSDYEAALSWAEGHCEVVNDVVAAAEPETEEDVE